MVNIHISAPPGMGKTSYCLVTSRSVLNDGGRVFWISGEKLNHERFSQIMSKIQVTKASNFHLLSFEDDSIPNNGFCMKPPNFPCLEVLFVTLPTISI